MVERELFPCKESARVEHPLLSLSSFSRDFKNGRVQGAKFFKRKSTGLREGRAVGMGLYLGSHTEREEEEKRAVGLGWDGLGHPFVFLSYLYCVDWYILKSVRSDPVNQDWPHHECLLDALAILISDNGGPPIFHYGPCF